MKKISRLIVMVIAMLAVPAAVLASPPSIPLLVYGDVIIDNQPALVKTEILAEINGVEILIETTKEGKYFIEIPDGKSNEGKMITFKVNGIANSIELECVNVSVTPSINFDLAVSTVVESEPAQTNSSGGGGGTYTPPAAPPVEDEDDQETPKIPVVKGVTTVNIFNGDIIVNPNAEGLARFDVYIVKIVGDKKFRRLILSPHVFESYGHLKWENIKEINQETMNNFAISNLVRCQDPSFGVNDPKVYQLTPNGDKGTKRWMNMSAKAFQSAGHNWNAIYIINKVDRDAYVTGEEII